MGKEKEGKKRNTSKRWEWQQENWGKNSDKNKKRDWKAKR